MKKLITLALVLIATTAFANSLLPRDGSKTPVQMFSPNGTLTQALTVVSVTADYSNYLYFGYYVPSSTTTCKIRTMATSAKGTNRQSSVIGAAWTVEAVNPATPFVNFSGCTSGEVRIH